MIVDRCPVRRRIFKSDIAFEEPPREEILGLTDLAAILEAWREGLSRAAINANCAAVEGIVAGLDVEHARGAQAELRRQRAGDQRHVADQRGIQKRAEAGHAVRQHDAVDADLHIGVLVAHVKAAASCGILRHAWGLQEYLFDRLIVAPRKRLNGVVTDRRRNGPDRRIDCVQSLIEGVRRRGDRIDRRCSGRRWRRRRRGRRRWARSRTRLFGLRFRFWFRLFLRRRDNDLRKLGLCGYPSSEAERRKEGRTAKRGTARSAKSKHGHQKSFLIAATNGQIRLNRGSRCRGRSKMMGVPRLSARRRRRVRAARRQISNDRESGEGRSARLKRRTLRRDKNITERAEVLDRSERERHPQERCIWQK